MHCSQPEQRVLDLVVREDGEWAVRREISLEQRSREAKDARKRLPIRHGPPIAVLAALCDEAAIGSYARPMNQPLGDAAWIGAEPLWGSEGAGCRLPRAPA